MKLVFVASSVRAKSS